MPWLETTCTPLCNDAHLHPFQSTHFDCLMLFANLQFSPFVYSFCMMKSKCNRCCWFFAFVFVPFRYALRVPNNTYHVMRCAHKHSPGSMSPKFLEYLVVLCCVRRRSKRNTVACLRPNIWPQKKLGWLYQWLNVRISVSLCSFDCPTTRTL